MRDDKRVAETTVADRFWVSTVRLSVDHGFGGQPLWYETMVFDCDAAGLVTSWSERDMDRYTTEAEAKDGHMRMVAKWKVEAIAPSDEAADAPR